LDSNSVLLFTRNGLGEAPEALQQLLAKKFLSLLVDSETLPAKILFYTDGVKLACKGSSVLDQLRTLEAKGVELILLRHRCPLWAGPFSLAVNRKMTRYPAARAVTFT
jgi:hypothetical protein